MVPFFPWKLNVFLFHMCWRMQSWLILLSFWVSTLCIICWWLHAKVWPLWPWNAFKIPWPHYGNCSDLQSQWLLSLFHAPIHLFFFIQSFLHASYPFFLCHVNTKNQNISGQIPGKYSTSFSAISMLFILFPPSIVKGEQIPFKWY